jgi:hypothetical protein
MHESMHVTIADVTINNDSHCAGVSWRCLAAAGKSITCAIGGATASGIFTRALDLRLR